MTDTTADTTDRADTADEEHTRPPVPASAALYIDADNQSPAIAEDLLVSVGEDWALELSRVVLAGNDHGQSVARWQTALLEHVPADCLFTLEVPRTPEAADLALILELGAAMERHRQQVDLVIILSRDEWLIAAAEAASRRGCRVWVAYAQTDTAPARTRLPTLLLPAVQRSDENSRPRPLADLPPPAAEVAAEPQALGTVPPGLQTPAADLPLLSQLRAQCQQQPGGGYASTDVGQMLYRLGLTTKGQRERFLRTVPGLREIGTGPNKRLLF